MPTKPIAKPSPSISLLTNYSSKYSLIRTNPGKRLSLLFEILPIKRTGQLSVIKMVYMQVKAKIKLI